jgi:hypothetical protein
LIYLKFVVENRLEIVILVLGTKFYF